MNFLCYTYYSDGKCTHSISGHSKKGGRGGPKDRVLLLWGGWHPLQTLLSMPYFDISTLCPFQSSDSLLNQCQRPLELFRHSYSIYRQGRQKSTEIWFSLNPRIRPKPYFYSWRTWTHYTVDQRWLVQQATFSFVQYCLVKLSAKQSRSTAPNRPSELWQMLRFGQRGRTGKKGALAIPLSKPVQRRGKIATVSHDVRWARHPEYK